MRQHNEPPPQPERRHNCFEDEWLGELAQLGQTRTVQTVRQLEDEAGRALRLLQKLRRFLCRTAIAKNHSAHSRNLASA